MGKGSNGALKNSPVVILFWLCAVTMMVIGAIHFYEDTLSSRYGLEWLSDAYGVIPAAASITWWTMSLSPQVGQIVFGFLYISALETNRPKRERRAYIFGLLLCMVIDTFSDVFYRSNHLATPTSAFAGFLITLLVFTIGSEIFLSIGFSLTIKMFPYFTAESAKAVRQIIIGIQIAKSQFSNRNRDRTEDRSNKPGGYVPDRESIFHKIGGVRHSENDL